MGRMGAPLLLLASVVAVLFCGMIGLGPGRALPPPRGCRHRRDRTKPGSKPAAQNATRTARSLPRLVVYPTRPFPARHKPRQNPRSVNVVDAIKSSKPDR